MVAAAAVETAEAVVGKLLRSFPCRRSDEMKARFHFASSLDTVISNPSKKAPSADWRRGFLLSDEPT